MGFESALCRRVCSQGCLYYLWPRFSTGNSSSCIPWVWSPNEWPVQSIGLLEKWPFRNPISHHEPLGICEICCIWCLLLEPNRPRPRFPPFNAWVRNEQSAVTPCSIVHRAKGFKEIGFPVCCMDVQECVVTVWWDWVMPGLPWERSDCLSATLFLAVGRISAQCCISWLSGCNLCFGFELNWSHICCLSVLDALQTSIMSQVLRCCNEGQDTETKAGKLYRSPYTNWNIW